VVNLGYLSTFVVVALEIYLSSGGWILQVQIQDEKEVLQTLPVTSGRFWLSSKRNIGQQRAERVQKKCYVGSS